MRPCPYCQQTQTNLSRHIKREHSCEKAVQDLLKQPAQVQVKLLGDLKKIGIFDRNKQHFGKETMLIREKQASIKKETVNLERNENETTKFKACGKCNATLDRKCMHRHRKICYSKKDDRCADISMSSIMKPTDNEDAEFQRNVLAEERYVRLHCKD